MPSINWGQDQVVTGLLTGEDLIYGLKNKDLGEILNSPNYQGNLEQKISKLVKILVVELIEKGLDFKERTATIRKTRKVGRPKRERKVGRPKDTGIDY